MNKRLIISLGAAVLAIAVLGTSIALAAGPGERGVGRMAEQAFVDEDGDGVCGVCGQAEPGAGGYQGRGAMGSPQSGLRGRGVGRDEAWHEISMVTVAAEALGLSEQQVRDELAEGKTLADVIAAHCGSADQIVDAYVAARQALLDQWVAEGRITQAQADLMLERIAAEAQEHLTEEGACEFGTPPMDGTGRGRSDAPTAQGRPGRGMGRGRTW